MAQNRAPAAENARLQMGVQDALWLEMDRPTNLMVADVLVETASPLDVDKLRAAIGERFVDRYPVFRSIAVAGEDGCWWWETSEDFDLAAHFAIAALDDPDDPVGLQRLMSDYRVRMLDRNRPLWQVIVVPRYRQGSAMIFRSHHCVADGIRMLQLAMSLFDAAPEGGAILAPPASPGSAPGHAALSVTGRPTGAGLPAALGKLDAYRKFFFGPRNDISLWTGTAGAQKGIAWSEPLPLARVKAVARAHHCTVNDVLVATVASTLHDYLQARGAACSSVTFMVPVNLKPLDLTMPETLGNEFALTQLELATGEPDALKVLHIAKRRMDRIKAGNEAALAFRLQAAIAGFSRGLYQCSVNLFTKRTLGVLTNVPGPPIPVYLAGSMVQSIVGWAPVAGDQPMSFSICSYNGTVTVGIACDTELVPGFEAIVGGFAAAFDRLVERTPGVSGIAGRIPEPDRERAAR